MSKRKDWDKIMSSLEKNKPKSVKLKNRNTAYVTRYRLLNEWDGVDIQVREDTLVITLI